RKPCAARSPWRRSRYARSDFISSDSRSVRSLKCRAAQPSATWTSSSSAPVRRARSATCVRIVRSAPEFSTATRIFRYIGSAAEDLIEQPRVQQRNDNRDDPRQQLYPDGIHERPHLGRIARKDDERKHREGQ